MPTALELTLLLLAASVAAVVLFRLLDLPPMLGYLVAGIVIGPYSLGLITETEDARYLAEFGVVFLMFSIGLEFSLPKLMSMRRIVFGLGFAQVTATILLVVLVGALIGPYLGIGLAGSFVLGATLAMSSTAIVVKLLSDRMELDSEHGKRIMGVLLFQDLAVIPLMVVIPALGSGPENLGAALMWAAVKAVVLLTILLAGGQWVLRRWLHLVARRKSHELFMLNLLLLVLGLAWTTEHFGLSMALGAFVAGMLISETEYRHQVAEDIKPFRDVLLGLFFITIGMLLNVGVVARNFGWVMLALSIPLVVKTGLVVLLARGFGAGAGTAIRTALALAAAGEFGFVLMGLSGELLPGETKQIVLAAMLMSMLAAPFLIQYSDRIAMRFAANEWMMRALQLHQVATRSMAIDKHVIICGYGRSGQHLAKMLEQEDIEYVALDLDPDRVREAAAAGDSVVYGDAARRETLIAAGLMRASALVVSYSNTPSALRVIHFAHEVRPQLPIIVRTQDDTDMEALLQAGASEVVPEVFEGSLMLGSHALLLLGVPIARVVRRVRQARDTRYRFLRGHFHGSDPEDFADELQARLHSLHLDDDAAAIGQTIGALGLQDLGVDVTAVRRRGIRGTDPSDELVLQPDDVIVLRGLPQALELAEAKLLRG